MGNFKFNFSGGIRLRAEVSISSSQMYSKCYHAMSDFLVTLFLPLLLRCSAKTILIICQLQYYTLT